MSASSDLSISGYASLLVLRTIHDGTYLDQPSFFHGAVKYCVWQQFGKFDHARSRCCLSGHQLQYSGCFGELYLISGYLKSSAGMGCLDRIKMLKRRPYNEKRIFYERQSRPASHTARHMDEWESLQKSFLTVTISCQKLPTLGIVKQTRLKEYG